MKYRGDLNKLEKLGYKIIEYDDQSYYAKERYKAFVLVNIKTKQIEYSGPNAIKLLKEIIKIK